jgi:homoserine dehydrogenase
MRIFVTGIGCVGKTTVVLTDAPENILNRIMFYDMDSRPIEKRLTHKERQLYLREIKKDITYVRKTYDRDDMRVDISGLNTEESAEKVERSLDAFLKKEHVPRIRKPEQISSCRHKDTKMTIR